uniref:Peptidylprolyl isomerase n=1 Tax=Alexandrium monilatum TaxID=311494 RepID=A0A7S4QU61_9DINO
MPSIPVVREDAGEEDIPLLNVGDPAEDIDPLDYIEEVERSPSSGCSTPPRLQEEEEDREEPFEKEEGRFYDDPLWFGKTVGEIRVSTDRAKVLGNDASREADWKSANRFWKNALRGAEKLKDTELELRLRLNLALGYTRRGKPERALEHCAEIFRERLKSVATPELRAKAHFRRGEAHEASGEESKAVTSFKAVLEIEPENAEALRKLAKLQRSEAQRQRRERQLFRGMLNSDAARTSEPPVASVEVQTPPEAGDAAEPAAGAADSEGPSVTGLTDRAAAARLAKLLGAGQQKGPALEDGEEEEEDRADLPGLNMEVGQKVEIFGRMRPADDEVRGAAAGGDAEASEISRPD